MTMYHLARLIVGAAVISAVVGGAWYLGGVAARSLSGSRCLEPGDRIAGAAFLVLAAFVAVLLCAAAWVVGGFAPVDLTSCAGCRIPLGVLGLVGIGSIAVKIYAFGALALSWIEGDYR